MWPTTTTETATDGNNRYGGRNPVALKSKYFQPPGAGRRSSLASVTDSESDGELATMDKIDEDDDDYPIPPRNGRIPPTSRPDNEPLPPLPTQQKPFKSTIDPIKAESFDSPVDVRPPRSTALTSAKNHTSTLIDTAKWGVRYNVKEVQGATSSPSSNNSPLPPGVQDLRDQNGRSASLTLTEIPRSDSPHDDPPRSSSVGGLLQTVSAAANGTVDEAQAGDKWEDESQASWQHGDDGAAKQAQAREQLSEKPKIQMPQLPPKLPLLYFEQDHTIGQIDFAYKQSQGQPKSPRKAGKEGDREGRSTPVADVNGLLTTKRASPRPSPPPINTSIGQKPTSKIEQQFKAKTPPTRQDKKGEGQGDSFFWGSPRSSADGNSPKQTEAPKKLNIATAVKKPGPGDPSVASLVSSSALGFGGPSDWEHFGDYNAEEVDDIDLYVSNKPKTAELPTDTTPSDTTSADSDMLGADDLSGLSPSRVLNERKALSTIEERASENLEEVFGERKIESQMGEKIDADAIFSAHPPPPPPRDSQEQGSSNRNSSKSDAPSSGASTSTETINRISFDVPPPPESAQSETSSRKSHHLEENQPSFAVGQRISATSGSASISSDSTADKASKTEDSVRSNTEYKVADASDGNKASHNSSAFSSMFSPTSDDGKEDIIISLQVPGAQRASASSASPAPLDLAKVRQAREQQDTPKSPDLLRSGRKSIYPGSVELESPYEGLEVWAKASLNRYVKMLREEAKAESDEDKYMTFANFMQKELHTRAVFYDMDDESDTSDHAVKRVPSKKKHPEKDKLAGAPPIPVGPGGVAKALPALPSNPEPTPSHSPPKQSSPVPPTENKSREGSSGSTEEQTTPPATQSNPKLRELKNEVKDKDKGLRGAPSLNALRKALDIVATRKSSLTPKDAQALATATGQPDQAAFSPEKPPQEDATNVINTKDESLTIPDNQSKNLGVNEGKPYEGDKAANRQSIYQPFSAMLRQSSIKSGTSEPRSSQNFTGPGSFAGSDGKLTPHRNQQQQKSQNYRYTVLEPLIAVVPQGPVLRVEPEQLVRLRQGMENIPDDFSFIHKTVLAWDADAKRAREGYDRERQGRVGQNEQRLDELFNEQAITYSDLNRLEEDFKRSEAAKKAEEDREEVSTFVASVFDVVWARINYEMDQLTPLYDECTRLVADASAGRGMFEEDTTTAVPIAPAMESLLTLYQKLMVRHQKAFEAVLERDRRLKKVEVAPWYAVGAVDKVKKIEKRFEDAEKKAILEFCRQRDERANLLMDVLDQNTLRGVGANQDYMESVMQAIRSICDSLGAVNGSIGKGDVVSTDEVLKAKTITTALARSSEQIVQTFHVADMLLNAADYEVSVANAKLNGADAAAFRRLRDAKAKEDSKLALDLEHRMGLIRGDTGRTQEEINKLLVLIEEHQGGPRSKDGTDPEREQRFREALEEAKRKTNQI